MSFDDPGCLWHGKKVPNPVVKKALDDDLLVGNRLLVTIGTKMVEAVCYDSLERNAATPAGSSRLTSCSSEGSSGS